MKQADDDVLEFLSEYPDAIADVARRLREVVQGAVPGAQEELDRTGRVIGYGFGPGYSGLLCTIIPSKKGVKLGIVHGARLPDPHGLLEGPGKLHRYVAFAKPADLEKSGLKDLLRSAVTAWKERSKRKV
ncbi:MAG TPA: DUF1801 domain-containing protein [Chthoniobacterales bacterium]|nr:DUF1801 domain-containing protein [Chthoniobacterales bacterium]